MDMDQARDQVRGLLANYGHEGAARLFMDAARDQLRELEIQAETDSLAYVESRQDRSLARARLQIWATTSNALAAVGVLKVSWRGLIRI
jgi:hypothetical protein